MSPGILQRLFGRRPETPEELVEHVMSDMRHRLTEARIRMMAADLARQRISCDTDDAQYWEACAAIKQLEQTLSELELKRNLLISRARDADARVAIEHALLYADGEPAQVALDLISDRITKSESEAHAVADIRQITGGGDA